MLEVISVSAKGQLSKHVQRAGGMDAIVWDGSAEEIRFTVKATPAEEGRDPARDSLTYKMTIGRLGKSSGYNIDYEVLGDYYKVDTRESSQPFKFLERDRSRSQVFDEDARSFAAPPATLQDE